MTMVKEAVARPEDRFVAAFERSEGHTLNGSNLLVQGLRREAIGHFSALGFPTRKTEAWKYTPIERLFGEELSQPLTAAPEGDCTDHLNTYRIPGVDAYEVVLVNGRVASNAQALPEGVHVMGLGKAAEAFPEVVDAHLGRYAESKKEVFTALNTAFLQDGLFVHVAAGTVLDRPLFVLNIAETKEAALFQPRNLIVLEEGASINILERSVSSARARLVLNAVTEVSVARNASLTLYKVQQEQDDAGRVDTLQVRQDRDSTFTAFTVTFSGAVVRNNVNVLIDGEEAETHLYGLFLGRGNMHVDNHTHVIHAQPSCRSNEMYKGILDDTSTGVFNGKVFVRPGAQQTNAYQSNKSVVLSDQAHMYSKPELEIYADDVKCSHGATTGHLDEEAMFYLLARGIPKERARAMLLLAFARDVIDRVEIEPLREYLSQLAEEGYRQS